MAEFKTYQGVKGEYHYRRGEPTNGKFAFYVRCECDWEIYAFTGGSSPVWSKWFYHVEYDHGTG